jgi:predicted nucleic-acid-binding Zn-ribbon protein
MCKKKPVVFAKKLAQLLFGGRTYALVMPDRREYAGAGRLVFQFSNRRIALKTTGTCPKCESRDVIRIVGSIGEGGNNITAGMTIWSCVLVTRFLCSQCGYSEEWIESPADLMKLRKKYGSSGGGG